MSNLGLLWTFAFWRWLWRWRPSLLVFSSLLHKASDIEIYVFTSGVPKCLWTGIGGPQEMRQWVLSMISANEIRPKDRVREGALRLDSGVLVCRFCWWVIELIEMWRLMEDSFLSTELPAGTADQGPSAAPCLARPFTSPFYCWSCHKWVIRVPRAFSSILPNLPSFSQSGFNISSLTYQNELSS